jgi:hypothetical protein
VPKLREFVDAYVLSRALHGSILQRQQAASA